MGCGVGHRVVVAPGFLPLRLGQLVDPCLPRGIELGLGELQIHPGAANDATERAIESEHPEFPARLIADDDPIGRQHHAGRARHWRCAHHFAAAFTGSHKLTSESERHGIAQHAGGVEPSHCDRIPTQRPRLILLESAGGPVLAHHETVGNGPHRSDGREPGTKRHDARESQVGPKSVKRRWEKS